MTREQQFAVPLNEYGHVVTRDGRQAKIVMRDVKHKYYPLLALVLTRDDATEFVHQYTDEGRVFYSERRDDAGDIITADEHATAQAEALFE